MIGSILEWLTSSATWSGDSGLGARIVQHLWYSLLAVAIAAVVAIPLGLWVGHTGRARWLVTLANSLRAVPTLGLLFAVLVLVLWMLGLDFFSGLLFGLLLSMPLAYLLLRPSRERLAQALTARQLTRRQAKGDPRA